MRPEVRAVVCDPALAEVMSSVRVRYELNGGPRGVARLGILQPEESRALDRLWPATARRRPRAGHSFDLDLARWDAHLCTELGVDLRLALEVAEGRTLDLRPQRLSGLRRRRDAFWTDVLSHPLCLREPALAGWIARLRDTGRPLGARPWEPEPARRLRVALTVGGELPCHPPVERSALAAELLDGDAHGLDDDQPIARLLLSQLAARAGVVSVPRSAVDVRLLWQRFGVLCDSASAIVLTLNLAPLPSSPLAQAIGLLHGQHVGLTLGQLERATLQFGGGVEAFLCENPTVVLHVEAALGASSPPLICTGGWPNGAVCRLLDQLRSSEIRLRHHGDFDWAGVSISSWLRQRYGVTSWCFDPDCYEAAMSTRQDRLGTLDGEPPRSLADDPLAAVLTKHRRAVPEELVLRELIDDLRSRSGSTLVGQRSEQR